MTTTICLNVNNKCTLIAVNKKIIKNHTNVKKLKSPNPYPGPNPETGRFLYLLLISCRCGKISGFATC
jgi:hypothetical protein